MVAVQSVFDKSLVVFTPLVQSTEHNVVRISRVNEIDAAKNKVLHIGGGEHAGIIINGLSNEPPMNECDVALSFAVWVTDGIKIRQENRQLRFRFDSEIDYAEKHSLTQQFFRNLISSLPRDYASFLKRVLKLVQNGYWPLLEVEVDMQFVKAEEAMQMPDPKEYDSDSECENVNIGHVKDVLEHAYPNGLTIDVIAEALRCSATEVEDFLQELEKQGVIKKVENEWIRVDTVNEFLNKPSSTSIRDHPPTIAIITCLFVEKQSVDAIINDSTTMHRYRSGGDSNIYTLGWVGPHRVVATKLAVIGDSREATTSAGSITTRLLGNFQNIEHVFVVGVGGGVAHYTDAEKHVRLGDVVVSSSDPDSYVFAHSYAINRRTETVDGFLVRRWNPQDSVISQIAKGIDDKFNAEWAATSEAMTEQLSATLPDFNLSRPKPEADLLTLPIGGGNMVVVPHPNQERSHPIVHVGPIGAMAAYRRQTNDEQTNAASGDTARDAASQLRDRFAAEYGLKAIDAGFDSVVAAVSGSRIDSWALVRGVADYQHGQSRVGRSWQAYAGVQAVAVTKSLILRLPTRDS